MNQKLSNEQLLEGIRERNRRILRRIYEDYFPMINQLILNNRGTEEDAQDIFQDALSMMYEKAKQDTLHFNCAFKTYLYAVCRNMWLMVLRKKKTEGAMVNDTENGEVLDNSLIQDMTYARRKQVFKSHLENLGKDCQRVLEYFFAGKSLKYIASQMGFTEAYAKKRKFVCQQKLITSIEQDALFRELAEY